MAPAEDYIDAGGFHRLIVHGHMHTGPHFTLAQRQILSYTLVLVCVFLCTALLPIILYLGCPLTDLCVSLRPNGLQDVVGVGKNKTGVEYQETPGYPIHTAKHHY